MAQLNKMTKWAKWCVNHNLRFILHIANWTIGLLLRVVIMCGEAINEAIRETISDHKLINREKKNV